MIDGVEYVSFLVHGDDRGKLVAIESNHDLDFDIKRIYYIYDTGESVVRGQHAHIDLHQVMLCVNGSCDVLLDNGHERQVVSLNCARKGIYIHGFVWREMMNFSKDCILLVMVDKFYDKGDYIFDYNEFLAMTSRREQQRKEDECHGNSVC